MNTCNILLLTAGITGAYDILVRYLSLYRVLNYDWLIALRPYFKQHTMLSAALIAAFVGFISQLIITSIHPFPTKNVGIISYILVTILVSATIGIIMDVSGLFPHLSNTYYKDLGRTRSMITDTYSGLIVQFTLLVIVRVYNIYFGK
jgi:H+/gluconate symporter-like permease